MLLDAPKIWLAARIESTPLGYHVSVEGDRLGEARMSPLTVQVRTDSGRQPKVSATPWRKENGKLVADITVDNQGFAGGWVRFMPQVAAPGCDIVNVFPLTRFFGGRPSDPELAQFRRDLVGKKIWSRGPLFHSDVKMSDDGKAYRLFGEKVSGVWSEEVLGANVIWGGNPPNHGTEALARSVVVDRPILVKIGQATYRFVSPQQARKLLSLSPPSIPARFRTAFHEGRLVPGMPRSLASFILGMPVEIPLSGRVAPGDPWRRDRWSWAAYAPWGYAVFFRHGRILTERNYGQLP